MKTNHNHCNHLVRGKPLGLARFRVASFLFGGLALPMMLLSGGAAWAGALASFTDADWINSFGLPGANGDIAAIVADTNGNIYVGGNFTDCGAAFAPGIAKWDGTAWSPLGSGVTYDSLDIATVTSLALDHSGNLYAGGAFTMAGGINATNVAVWNGSHWSALGEGIGGLVNTLAVDHSGNLYAGGLFTNAGAGDAAHIAEWNGTQWSALGTGTAGGITGEVNSLAFDESGNLYAGGDFTMAGAVAATNIAEWDGTQWHALGPGLSGSEVATIAFDTSGNLYAGGLFMTSETNPPINIAEWNGIQWSPVGGGLNGNVNDILFDTSGNLYACGGFTIGSFGNVTLSIGEWNGSTWEPIGAAITSGLDANVNHMAFDTSGNLYAGGTFTVTGTGQVADYISKWNGTNWLAVASSLESGMNSEVIALAADKSGNVYAGGSFTGAGAIRANSIAKWNGANWVPLSSGLTDAPAGQNVAFALTIDPSGNLYVGGDFVNAGETVAKNIAEWNGTNWSAVGTGVNSYVTCLACDPAGNLYAGGLFTRMSGTTVNYVSQWNGANWLALDNGANGQVNALVCDKSGNLYVGGNFTGAGSVAATNIAEWNGSQWLPLGSGINGGVNALAMDSAGNLYAGGAFTMAGNANATNIAEWNGTNWSALGFGVGGNVNALAFDNSGNLYAGGDFQSAGTNAAHFIAAWNGVNWLTLGSGMGGGVNALVRDSAGNLYIGGNFATAGTNVSSYIAKALLAGPALNEFTIVKLNSQSNIISYLGNPGAMYALDFTTSLIPPIHWTPQSTNVASPSGYAAYTNASALPAAFYRARLVP
jgi:trimeric autotransporter adhesin